MKRHFLNWKQTCKGFSAVLLNKVYSVVFNKTDWSWRIVDYAGTELAGRYTSADSAISHFENMIRGA